jgi:hypothetical protein
MRVSRAIAVPQSSNFSSLRRAETYSQALRFAFHLVCFSFAKNRHKGGDRSAAIKLHAAKWHVAHVLQITRHVFMAYRDESADGAGGYLPIAVVVWTGPAATTPITYRLRSNEVFATPEDAKEAALKASIDWIDRGCLEMRPL